MVNRVPYLELEIDTGTGWKIGDLQTVEDCDEAAVHLTREIASIEAQLEEHARDIAGGMVESDDDADWARSARAARSVKRSVHDCVLRRRNDIDKVARRALATTHNQQLLDTLRATAPEAFAAAVASLGVQ